jgi:hypothetical protein
VNNVNTVIIMGILCIDMLNFRFNQWTKMQGLIMVMGKVMKLPKVGLEGGAVLRKVEKGGRGKDKSPNLLTLLIIANTEYLTVAHSER